MPTTQTTDNTRPIGCQHAEDPSGHDRECECPDAEELAAWLDAQEDEES